MNILLQKTRKRNKINKIPEKDNNNQEIPFDKDNDDAYTNKFHKKQINI